MCIPTGNMINLTQLYIILYNKFKLFKIFLNPYIYRYINI